MDKKIVKKEFIPMVAKMNLSIGKILPVLMLKNLTQTESL